MKPSAVAAAMELSDGCNDHGLSTIKLSGTRHAVAQSIVPVAVTVGVSEENRLPGIARQRYSTALDRTANCPIVPLPSPRRASRPTIKITPASPKSAPVAFHAVTSSCRVTNQVNSNTNIGEVEFSTPARLLSTA